MRNSVYRVAFIILPVMLLSACASKGKFIKLENTNTNPTHSIVYIYRPHGPPILRKPEIRINGTVLGDLKMWGYFAFTVKPGKYAIEVDWPWDTTIRDYKLEFAVVAGETYYLRVSSKMGRIYYIGGPIVEFEGSASTTNKVKALAELRCGTNSCKITQ